MQDIALNNKTLILIGIVSVLFMFAAVPYAIPVIALPAVAILYYLYRDDFILFATIISFLVVTGPEIESVRSIINAVAMLLLLFIFVRKFGFDFKSYPKVPVEVIYFLAVLFFSLLVSTLFSKDIPLGIISIARFGIFFLICYIFYSFIQNEKDIFKYFFAVLAVVLVLGGSILYELIKDGFSFLILGAHLLRYSGVYSNPNYVGLISAVSIPVMIALYFYEGFHETKKKLLLTFILILDIVVLLLSDSRSSLMSITISTAFVLFMLNRRLFYRTAAGIVAVLGGLLLIPSVQNILNLFLRLDRVSNRQYFWQTGIDIIKDHPFFGIGPDMFDKYFFTYMPSVVTSYYKAGVWKVGKPHPHNFFLYFTAENGILGLAAAVSFFWLFFYIAYKAIKLTKNRNRNYHIIAVGLSSIGFGIFARSFYEVTGYLAYGFITRDLPFWLIFIMLIFIYQKFKTAPKTGATI